MLVGVVALICAERKHALNKHDSAQACRLAISAILPEALNLVKLVEATIARLVVAPIGLLQLCCGEFT